MVTTEEKENKGTRHPSNYLWYEASEIAFVKVGNNGRIERIHM